MAGHADRLLELATEIGALTYGDYTLSWGGKSKFYFDGRLLSLEPEGAYIIGQALLPYVTGAGATAVGGPTLGADSMVAAIAMTSHMAGERISGFIVRKETKGHGTGKLIEGPLTPGSKVAIVDDTCSTGGSLFQAIAAAEDAGCQVVKVLSVLDRREGGSEKLRERGYDFSSLLIATPAGESMIAEGA